MDGNDEKSASREEKREARRRRRKRNQAIAYTVVILFVAACAAGIAYAVSTLTSMSGSQESLESEVNEILQTEETIEALQETETETVAELTDEQKLDEIVNAGIAVMPLEDKVAGIFLVTPESITGVSTAVQAGEGTQSALAQYAVGGIVYAAKNIQSADQLSTMIDNTQLYTKYPLFIAIEEEGGDMAPVAKNGIGVSTDSARTIGESGDTNAAYEAGTTIGGYLAGLGFNLDLAPVADLSSGDGLLGNRTYGSDAGTVSGYVTAMQRGLQDAGVTAAVGHFPGIGAATQNATSGLLSTETSAEELRANELTVFQAGIDDGTTQMIRVSTAAAPALTGDNTPCALSSIVVTDLLRGELGFDGVIVSDALSDASITNYYSAEQAAILALKAGCDMVYAPEDFEEAYNGVLQAVQDGTISEERINDSLRRIYRIKYADKLE